MKIVIDGRAIKHSGVGRYIEQVLEQILRIDNENAYILLVRSEDRDAIALRADNLTLVTADYPWYSWREQIRGAWQLYRLGADVVHFPNFNFPVLYFGRFVMTLHDLTLVEFKNINAAKMVPAYYHIKDAVRGFVMRTGMKRAKVILTDSEYVKDRIADYFRVSKRKVVAIPLAAEAVYQKPRVDLAKFGIDKPFILYVGNAYPHKNLERLILAYGKLSTDYMLDMQLVIAGRKDAFHERIEEDVKTSGLEKNVIFTDYVTESELAGLYKAAEIYSFPSLSEGFGLPGLEAMSYGLPVASSSATCLREVYGDAVVYYDPENVTNMAKVMADLISDKEKREELTRLGLKQVKKYSWKKTGEETLAVYKRARRKK